MANWFDAYPEVDTSLDSSFKIPELNVLDNLLGSGFKQQTYANYENPDYQDEQDAAQEAAYRHSRDMQREQTRQELQSKVQYEDIPLSDRALLGVYQGGLQLGRQAGGVLDALMVPGGRQLAQASEKEYQNLADLSDVPDRAEGLGGEFLQWFSNNATSVVPSMAAGYGAKLAGMGAKAFLASVAAAGAQTFGSVFEDARDAYEKDGIEPGTAKAKAYGPALLAGAITAALTHWGGPTAIEPGQITISAIREAIQQPVQTILRGFGKEATEEGLDQLSQGIIEKFSYNPNKTLGEIVTDAVQAGAAGGLLGGLGETAQVGRINAARALRRGGRGLITPATSLNTGAEAPSNVSDAAQAPIRSGPR
jgi:hypothetical protein